MSSQVLWRQDFFKCRLRQAVITRYQGVMCRHGILRRHGMRLHDASSGGSVSSGNES